MEYTPGELHLVSETEYDHIIYLRNKPNRQDKIVARFINKDDALLFLAAPKMYEACQFALDVLLIDGDKENAKYRLKQALAKAEGRS